MVITGFRDLGLSETTVKALEKKGFEEPTDIQAKAIPTLLDSDRDLIAQAQTGTGKTAAFGLPMVEMINTDRKKQVKAIVLTPTRELAIQVSEELNSFTGRRKMQIVPIYGGQSFSEQFRRLKTGIDIVVGTPGRIIDHLERGSLKIDHVDYVVLDEADEMLNMGFIDDIEKILKYTPVERRTLLFSATMPARIQQLAENYMKEYDLIKIDKQQLTASLTEQLYFEVAHEDKFEALCRIIDIEDEFYGLIFCRTKIDVDNVAKILKRRGYYADALHGDISQHQRERILTSFKKKRSNILVATDVAARGIDINNLTHVINYSLPQDPESYVHRIGRTGRAGKEGTAITFVTPDEYRRLVFIQRKAQTDIKREDIPDADEVVRSKIDRLMRSVNDIISTDDHEENLKAALDIIGNNDPVNAFAALLRHTYGKELNPASYSSIKKLNLKDTINTNSRTRLFIALGREDGYSPRSLVDMLIEKTGVRNRDVKDVRILDHFSFVTVPFEEAEIILQAFKSQKKGQRPVVSRAKEK